MTESLMAFKVDLLTISVLSICLLIVALFWQAARKGLSCLDLITDKGSGKMSLTKVMNLLGGVIGSWAVMRQAVDGKLTWDLLMVFLAYCAGTHGFSTWLQAKHRPGEGAPASARE